MVINNNMSITGDGDFCPFTDHVSRSTKIIYVVSLDVNMKRTKMQIYDNIDIL